jgi:AbrB family looped-hinge helix DNA binding protein
VSLGVGLAAAEHLIVRLLILSVYRPVILVKEENVMETAIVSPDFQVAIPQAIREALGIQPGQRVQVILYQSRIELLPIRSVREMRGVLKGIDTTVEREPDRT